MNISPYEVANLAARPDKRVINLDYFKRLTRYYQHRNFYYTTMDLRAKNLVW